MTTKERIAQLRAKKAKMVALTPEAIERKRVRNEQHKRRLMTEYSFMLPRTISGRFSGFRGVKRT